MSEAERIEALEKRIAELEETVRRLSANSAVMQEIYVRRDEDRGIPFGWPF